MALSLPDASGRSRYHHSRKHRCVRVGGHSGCPDYCRQCLIFFICISARLTRLWLHRTSGLSGISDRFPCSRFGSTRWTAIIPLMQPVRGYLGHFFSPPLPWSVGIRVGVSGDCFSRDHDFRSTGLTSSGVRRHREPPNVSVNMPSNLFWGAIVA